MPDEVPTTSQLRPRRKPSVLKRLRFLPVCIVCAGIVVYALFQLQEEPETVKFIKSIRVTRPSTMSIDASQILGSEPQDYFIRVELVNGTVQDLETFDDKLIGNGLTWNLAIPIALPQLAEISIWDDGLLKNECLDRVSIRDEMVATGQKYEFELLAENLQPDPADPRVLWSIVSGAGVLALVTAVLFIRDQAVP